MQTSQTVVDNLLRGRKAERVGLMDSPWADTVLAWVQQGYPTRRGNGRMQGFFHGTGHGLGLEIHEAPRVGSNSAGVLQPGQVVTVEPGLYYPDIGGVRLEDVALVTKSAPRNLTQFEKVLEV